MGTQREVKKVTLTVVTGDRGLCGAYNSFMIKKAEARHNELTAQGIAVDFVLVGDKGIKYFQRREWAKIRKTFPCGQNPNAKDALAISEELLNTFLSGNGCYRIALHTICFPDRLYSIGPNISPFFRFRYYPKGRRSIPINVRIR